jgi:hypothetical protein
MSPDFTMPDWMKPLEEHFANTGGWPVEELMREKVNSRINLPVAMLQVAVESQVILLKRLKAAGKLVLDS